jgi:cell division protein FtsB
MDSKPGMRWVVAILLALAIALQIPLWLGEGSFRDVRLLKQAIEEHEAENARLKARNRALEAEVQDLREGQAAIEERARTELGLIRQGETFFQTLGEGDGSPDDGGD